MNTVYIHQNEHCEIRIYQYSVAINTTLYIYVTNSVTDYTFKSVSITINNGNPIVIENDGSYAVTDIPEPPAPAPAVRSPDALSPIPRQGTIF